MVNSLSTAETSEYIATRKNWLIDLLPRTKLTIVLSFIYFLHYTAYIHLASIFLFEDENEKGKWKDI